MLPTLSAVAKQKQKPEILCPVCGERHRVIKHGFYRRYLFDGQDTANIQRYRCLNAKCPRQTFSILPYPFLPILRQPLCFLLKLLMLHELSGQCINALACATTTAWVTMRRRLTIAKRLETWLAAEIKAGSWHGPPCKNPQRFWTGFTQSLGHAFFPR